MLDNLVMKWRGYRSYPRIWNTTFFPPHELHTPPICIYLQKSSVHSLHVSAFNCIIAQHTLTVNYRRCKTKGISSSVVNKFILGILTDSPSCTPDPIVLRITNDQMLCNGIVEILILFRSSNGSVSMVAYFLALGVP
ncbi:MAG: hypothetical protein EZS28_026852 [Streblomastix strix]|uniref:Uncharacterized protein n=1 Tax=Streblomastix strix TaxID=222440 RepID=A0A5J4V5N8_9EUKA|nr:MAG: hypothetical protein EZS28_026852 [Streblomastix strix]